MLVSYSLDEPEFEESVFLFRRSTLTKWRETTSENAQGSSKMLRGGQRDVLVFEADDRQVEERRLALMASGSGRLPLRAAAPSNDSTDRVRLLIYATYVTYSRLFVNLYLRHVIMLYLLTFASSHYAYSSSLALRYV
nr:unnamed protein product [Haemonchus contortus]